VAMLFAFWNISDSPGFRIQGQKVSGSHPRTEVHIKQQGAHFFVALRFVDLPMPLWL
jgi:hypothetical protein